MFININRSFILFFLSLGLTLKAMDQKEVAQNNALNDSAAFAHYAGLKITENAYIVREVQNDSANNVTIINRTISGYSNSILIPKGTSVNRPHLANLCVIGGVSCYILTITTNIGTWKFRPIKSESAFVGDAERFIAPYTKLGIAFTPKDGQNEVCHVFDNLPYVPCLFKITITKEGLVTIGEECPICSDCEDNFLLPCGHTFCKPCVVKSALPEAKCPMCRSEFDMSALR